MTDALYSLHSARPEPLPFRIVMPDGLTRTDPSTFTAEEIAEAGYVAAPIPEHDSATHRADWIDGEWVVAEIPPPPPAPEPDPLPPIVLTVGQFTERFDPEADEEVEWFLSIEERIAGENALTRRQWANPATVMTESVGLWNILLRIMGAVGVPFERQTEILARS